MFSDLSRLTEEPPMCHDPGSRAPAPPVEGEVLSHGARTITSTDGTTISAYGATPAQPRGISIVLLPDVRGLHPYYADLAVRFAEAGYEALAIDYFDRLVGPGVRGGDFDHRPLVPQVRPENVAVDVRGAIDDLAARGAGPTFTVGFCFGGGLSWRMSAAVPEIGGAIGFYGRLSLAAEVVDDLQAPLLMLLAGADTAIKPEDLDAFTARLDDRELIYEKHVYEGAPHSFFDRSFADWQDASADAWHRILAFTDRYGGQV
jgi:carboxymethylenebutenolidase